MLRMDEVNKIRKEHIDKGKNPHQISGKYNRSWDTVNNIIGTPINELESRGKRPNREATVITPEVTEAIEKLLDLEESLNVKIKQRYTARWIFKKLVSDKIYIGKERTLRNEVKNIRKKRGNLKKTSYLPLEFPLGTAIQVDHGEAEILLEGSRMQGYLFVASIPGATIRYCQYFAVKSSEAWGEFHERMYLYFKGVFANVIYDNDSVLVSKIIGSERKQTKFSHSLEEHYGNTSTFCNKGAGNEKGSVENAVGYCRRNYLGGLQAFSSLSEINSYLDTQCTTAIATGTHYRTGEALSKLLSESKKHLKELPYKHDWVRWEDLKVTSYQTITLNNHYYSVPERYVGSIVRAAVGAEKVRVYHDHQLIAEHPRQFIEGSDSLNLDHYLDQLKIKPGAFWDCKAVHQHQFAPEILELWDRLKNRFELRAANKELIKILLLERKYSQEIFVTAIGLGLEYRAIEYASMLNIMMQLTMKPVITVTDSPSKIDLSGIPIDMEALQFNIDQYASLSGGGTHAN